MTPAARWAAAAEILDRIAAGTPAEKALTTWARRSRFAGSKDRAAVRDHVFDILRCWRSTAALGSGTTGRARVLGRLRQVGADPAQVFTGERHALDPLSPSETADGRREMTAAEACDLPDWLFTRMRDELGEGVDAIAAALRSRAPVFLRVNLARTARDAARRMLAEEGIEARPHPLSASALELGEGARRVGQSRAYLDGLVELQDVASQAVVDALPLAPGDRVLDFCAGGGGKALAMAARLGGPVVAHDANPARMSDLPARAARAGAQVVIDRSPRGPFDLVLCDAPCSGSGAWRRSPEGKWRLTADELEKTRGLQASILDAAAPLVGPSGVLAYATCSVLPSENTWQIKDFLARQRRWSLVREQTFLPVDGGDGFFVALMTRVS